MAEKCGISFGSRIKAGKGKNWAKTEIHLNFASGLVSFTSGQTGTSLVRFPNPPANKSGIHSSWGTRHEDCLSHYQIVVWICQFSLSWGPLNIPVMLSYACLLQGRFLNWNFLFRWKSFKYFCEYSRFIPPGWAAKIFGECRFECDSVSILRNINSSSVFMHLNTWFWTIQNDEIEFAHTPKRAKCFYFKILSIV